MGARAAVKTFADNGIADALSTAIPAGGFAMAIHLVSHQEYPESGVAVFKAPAFFRKIKKIEVYQPPDRMECPA